MIGSRHTAIKSVRELCFTSTAVQILTLTDWSKATGDQRTNIKLAMYNRYATAAMQVFWILPLVYWK
jgi:hypothetical protein